MKLISSAIVAMSILVPLSSCSSDDPADSASSSVSSSTNSSATSETTVPVAPGDTTATSTDSDGSGSGEGTSEGSGGNAEEFCRLLVRQAEEQSGLAGKLSGPERDSALAAVKASNELILSSAPDDVRDAVVTVNQVAELSMKVLTASDEGAAAAAAAEAAAKPETTQAFADYTTWVSGNCGELSADILGTGGG